MKKETVCLCIISFCVLALITPLGFADSDEEHGGDIIYTQPLKAVIFSHSHHVDIAEMDCDTCHDDIFEMESLAVQEKKDFTMEGLYDGKYCGACHDGSTAFASNSQCARCHIGVKGYNRIREADTGAENTDN